MMYGLIMEMQITGREKLDAREIWNALAKASYDGSDESQLFALNQRAFSPKQVRCYELIGYPEWWEPSKASQKRNSKQNHHASIVVPEPSNVSEESNNHVYVVVAESSIIGKVFHKYAPTCNNAWIIDSDATDHMTFDTNRVKSLKPSSQLIVSTTNGNPSPVAGKTLSHELVISTDSAWLGHKKARHSSTANSACPMRLNSTQS
ncbi:hypothetical protein Salat_1676400 [Sesamum alatum]|uniref:Uncharacterized protein n=1 Tax=Sesamum alatum TaxID=300844 RepID=A0AAE1Y843_9LAMI|nr:hypothetical protein Salat_1676400 [Sesamum alatum]